MGEIIDTMSREEFNNIKYLCYYYGYDLVDNIAKMIRRNSNYYYTKLDLIINSGGGTYISSYCNDVSKLDIYLDIYDVIRYSQYNDLDTISACKYIVSHEIFHALLGHFSNKYKNHNKQLLNIAGDLEINQLIGLKHPGLQVEDYGFKPYRNTDYYYAELLKEFENRKNQLSNSGPGSGKSDEEIISEMIPENRIVNNRSFENNASIESGLSNEALTTIEQTLKKKILTKGNSYTLRGLDEIIRRIEYLENEKKIMPHGRVSTYYKLNNRRKSDFILPGKKLTNSGLRKKLDSSLTVFIDTSGSTKGIVHKNLMSVARKLKSLGATIVYYTYRIEAICEPEDEFCIVYDGGYTRITDVIDSYIEDHSLNRAYVFTDGFDDFRRMKEVCDKFNVYFVSQGSVYEKYNEKSTKLI